MGSKNKGPVSVVHQNAILCETIMKEQRHQKLYTSYSVNPFKKSELATLYFISDSDRCNISYGTAKLSDYY